MSHLESNLSLLFKRQPALSRILRETVQKHVKVFESKRGGPTAVYKRDISETSLHSQYEPRREAHQILKNQDLAGADYFIFLGFGLGYLLDALLEEDSDPSHHYFIVESDLEILKAAFEARDLGKFLTLPHIHFAWPATGSELSEQWMHFFDPVHSRKSVYLTHNPSVSLNPFFYKSAAEIINSQTLQIFTDINTLVEKSQVFLDNFVRNIGKVIAAPGIANFTGKFPDTPAVIVSAGPSLDKNVHELRGYENRALILSTDTALKPLLAAGIQPHFILTGDPYYLNYRHLEGASIEHSLVVAETTAYPEVFNAFEDRTVVCTYENSSISALTDLVKDKGILRAWGSVATMALDFALLLKCNPVIFIGQDLAYTGGRIYCSGVCFEKEWFADIDSFESYNQRLIHLRSGRRTIKVQDIFGSPIESTGNLTSYWNWMLKKIQNNPEVRFINATEGGILKGNVDIVSLKEALYRHCSKPRPLRENANQIFLDSRAECSGRSNLNLSPLHTELSNIEKILADGIRLCRSRTIHGGEDLLNNLEFTKKKIYLNPSIASLLDCLNQVGNVNFLRSRNSLNLRSMEENAPTEIQDTYGEYFNTVRKALYPIKRALSQIRKNLNLP